MNYESRIMAEEKTKIKKFTDLDAWKEGHKLVLIIYDITRIFERRDFLCD